ncbi:hypothetical protein VTN00DRAFT_8132 [Thermoascus crustaceus]|uniref:uncharacterized protein n=1 Tax=Thermoascus crustaceus TaxID=5088 RepID=UPI0037442B00
MASQFKQQRLSASDKGDNRGRRKTNASLILGRDGNARGGHVRLARHQRRSPSSGDEDRAANNRRRHDRRDKKKKKKRRRRKRGPVDLFTLFIDATTSRPLVGGKEEHPVFPVLPHRER